MPELIGYSPPAGNHGMTLMATTDAMRRTDQLAVWKDLVEALEKVDAAWEATRAAGAGTGASSLLPGDVAVAMVKACRRATVAVVGVTDTLVEQYDSGETFQEIASVLRQAAAKWPAT
ncbi:hypothetical protein [Amycolatopsis albispora]|uniref:Uncharacterized protein n=1 Tax=Amycolatopsis albispora TaxID=1804986 RepID=A0A344L9N0_9PSEU|nr:hypothetical protein [Amycolatopsis albispora]AXB44754.1 hypothetical protein A4R43_21495 [Amycolatopsis albispora]